VEAALWYVEGNSPARRWHRDLFSRVRNPIHDEAKVPRTHKVYLALRVCAAAGWAAYSTPARAAKRGEFCAGFTPFATWRQR